MEFREILEKAKNGDKTCKEEIWKLYLPLLYKCSMINGLFNEDLFQELSVTLILCIKKFKI